MSETLREGVERESGVAGRLADIAWSAGHTGLSGELHDLRRRLALLAATAPTPDEVVATAGDFIPLERNNATEGAGA